MEDFTSADSKKSEDLSSADSKTPTERKGDSTEVPKTLGPPKKVHLKRRNICNVISNKFAKSQQPLPQYAIDEQKISSTFSWLNFEINLLKDRKANEIEDDINQMSKDDYSDKDCFVLFLLSHGNNKREIQGDDLHFVEIDWILEKLTKTKTQSLLRIPKLLFIQTCRGDKVMKANIVPNEAAFDAAAPAVRKAEKADTFIFYSTTQGHSSWLGSTQGSFFINVLCQVLQEYCVDETLHLGDVITKVNDVLSTHVCKQKRGPPLVQVSEVQHTLTSHVYFYPTGTYQEFMLNYK